MKLDNYHRLKSVLDLSLQIAKAEFKLRNEGSYLGILWYLLNPILMFLLLYLIFNDRLGENIPNYPLYLLIGVVIFNFFQSATIEATRSIVQEHRLIIKSINFPKESLILAIVFKNLFSHFFEILLFILLLLFLKMSIFGIFYYFILLIPLCFFVFGVSLILSSLTVYFVDLDNIWNFGVKILWFTTPVFYSIGDQIRLLCLNLFNPIYYFITIARELVIYQRIPENWVVFGAATYSLLFFFIGLFIFNRLKAKFAEMI